MIYESQYYGSIQLGDYLVHHGVKGQKWGVRRYQNPDGTLTEAGKQHRIKDTVKTAVKDTVGGAVKRHGIKNRGKQLEQVRAYYNFKNAEGVINKGSELFGHGRQRNKFKTAADVEKQLADASRTRLGKRIHETKSSNNRYFADYHEIKRTQDIGQRIFESSFYDVTLSNTKHERLSGRTTTMGRECVNYILTGGLAGLVLDAKYLRDKKRSSDD